jgi:hypothetical protein
MGKMLTVVVTLLGFGATVWNTISVEKKSAVLEDAEGLVDAMQRELETRELNYRLAIQEFNFSTLHAANAYELDGNEKFLGASVAPGTTMLRQTPGPDGGRPTSVRDRAVLRRESIKTTMRQDVPRPKADERAPEGPRAPALRPELSARQSIFARIAGPRQPERPPSAPAQPQASRKVLGALTDAVRSPRAVPAQPLGDDKRRELATVRVFQIENLSRWRQYMHAASHGEPMSQDQVARWEDLLADGLVRGDDRALGAYVDECTRAIEEWQASQADGRRELEVESATKAELEKEVDRGKSIYMGLMLVGLVFVTIKDVFGKREA